ncbi:hypothetical protein QTI69_05805 [Clostridium perfringens]|uniref:DUF6680 family protein n=1 Tax=Clostridium perfringens TaxID=1502 RepID=UPI0023655376|nr:DUF6680 family protein [Clostridium perfringens]EGT0689874.1 hypothetical protein [Clostridium perfringens]EHK2402054.1 hypothetical protein [Clostridium perfringens]ELC8409631.1 hypothetical protein [Clostridium perfringens]MDG6890752.1 hypothetical protein [Clostridium perfringens]MDH5076097.1 hypothetical protein [Clostridium perfringens]
MESNQNLIWMLFSVLCSGLLGVVISNHLNKKQQEKSLKLDLIKNILGYSHQLTRDTKQDDEILIYLNQIYIIFNCSNDVVDALLEYKKEKSAKKLVALIKSMCDDVEIDYDYIGDDFFDSPFSGKIE